MVHLIFSLYVKKISDLFFSKIIDWMLSFELWPSCNENKLRFLPFFHDFFYVHHYIYDYFKILFHT